MTDSHVRIPAFVQQTSNFLLLSHLGGVSWTCPSAGGATSYLQGDSGLGPPSGVGDGLQEAIVTACGKTSRLSGELA